MNKLHKNIVVAALLLATIIFLPTTYASSRARKTRREVVEKFEEFIKILDENYINSLDNNFLLEVAIRSILDHTDPYSCYLQRSEVDQLNRIINDSAIDTTYMVNDSTACIKVGLFSNGTSKEIEQIYTELDSPANLIIDLRGNKGGVVTEAVKCANLFSEKDTPIFKRINRDKSTIIYRSPNDGKLLSTRLIIVIDKESASASEIVAAALQNSKRATIVGERSHGKGLIIKPFTLPDGSVILLSTSQYTTPSGKKIQRSYKGRRSSNEDGGIIPDIKYYSDEPVDNEDYIKFTKSDIHI